MKFNIILSFLLVLCSGFQINAQTDSRQYATTLSRNGNVYSFYVIIRQKDSLLLRKDSVEDTYYGDRKIPDSIDTKINPYKNNELAVYWSEYNTLAEGETGSDGTIKKYVAVIDMLLKEEIFRYEYYYSRNGWKTEPDTETTGSRTHSYNEVFRNDELVFSKKKITIRNLKNKKVKTFLYNPYMSRYMEK